MGLILFLVWKDQKPDTAKKAGIGALISVVVIVLFYVLLFVFGMAASFMVWLMGKFIYKWLPVFFGCHCRSDRSFHWKEKQFPVCARCTGELSGILAGIVTGVFYLFPIFTCLLLLLPLVLDGLIQFLSSYESNNIRRYLTGVLFGLGLYMLAINSIVFVLKWGYEIGKDLHLSWLLNIKCKSLPEQ